MLQRTLEQALRQRLFMGKTILILSQSQVGKTTLARQLNNLFPPQNRWLNGAMTRRLFKYFKKPLWLDWPRSLAARPLW
jgi:energy-coupling factor transporter ATP-binding protein EcfA2